MPQQQQQLPPWYYYYYPVQQPWMVQEPAGAFYNYNYEEDNSQTLAIPDGAGDQTSEAPAAQAAYYPPQAPTPGRRPWYDDLDYYSDCSNDEPCNCGPCDDYYDYGEWYGKWNLYERSKYFVCVFV